MRRMKDCIIRAYLQVRKYIVTHMGVPVALSMIGLLLAAMLILQSYVKNQYFSYLLEETDRRESVILEATAANIDNTLRNLIETGCRIAVNSDFRDTVERARDKVGRNRFVLREALNAMANYSNSIAAVAVVTENGLLQEYGRYWEYGGYGNLWAGENLEDLNALFQGTMDLLKQRYGIRYCVGVQPSAHEGLPQTGLFHLALPLMGGSSSWENIDSVVVVTFRMDAVVDNDALSGYMTDSGGDIIYHANGQFVGLRASEYREQLTGMEDISYDLPYFGWTIHAQIDLQEMHERVNRMYRTSIAVYLLLLLTCGVIWQFVIRRVLRPVSDLRRAMEDIRLGRQRKMIAINGSHEIWQLAQDYNTMLVALHEQQEETERQYREKTLSINQKNRAEQEALESQINAHFLCNTLAAISYNAVDAGDEEVADLLKKLSNMLAYSFSRRSAPITLEQEIRWVEEYLYLQKFRLMEVFDYQINFPGEYGEWPSCKLFLQPFVENSILHGFEGCERGGRIVIEGRPDGRRFRLSVSDNGRGMAPEVERIIQQILKEKRALELEGAGIGIQNAVTRLRMFYGDELTIEMWTVSGEGTCFTFWLPLVINTANENFPET